MSQAVKLEVKGITKTFPGVKALDNVSFSVKKGTVHMSFVEKTEQESQRL
jgi:inositol transport system ATP-binding protein